MLDRRSARIPALLFSATACLSLAQTAKRPIDHHDYDGWRSISAQRLSPDGKFLAYGLFPQEGDGEVVIRNLVSGQENRYPAGARPLAPPANQDNPEEQGPPVQPTVTITFSADSRTAVFSTFLAKGEVDKAKREKNTADQMPKNGMAIVDLASGRATRVERVKRFQMPDKASGWLAYLREGPGQPSAGPSQNRQQGDSVRDQRGGRGGRGGAGGVGTTASRPEFGSDLVLRNLADSTEHTFSDVVEFSLTDDGKQLVYAIGARDTSRNGVFVVRPGAADTPAALLAGKGKYAPLVWDETQTELAFLSDRDDAGSTPSKWKLYRWGRQSTAAQELVSSETPGFRKEFVISDHGNVTFSQDGTRIFFACAPPAPQPGYGDDAAAGDKAVVELWHYKDDYIQPIQKVRAQRDRNRTYMAMYSIPDRKVVQLADAALAEVTPSEDNRWALGSDDRAYRIQNDYEEHYSDAWLVDSTTGQRRLMIKKHLGAVTWSPSGRYMLTFDGKDWSTVSVPDGKIANLTAGLPAKFFNEDDDRPQAATAYGTAGWMKDGKHVLLYDRYDIWRVAPDGTGAKNITAGYGRQHNMRLHRLPVRDDAHERWIDPAQPLLIFGENLKTWESGFFRGSLDGGEPKQFVMAAKFFTPPVKAKNADVYLFTEQSFSEFPDLVTTDGSFRELRKVSLANPQQAQLSWGSSEVVEYRNIDGVPLTAALYKPENFGPHKRYPMLVYVYEKLTQNVNHFVDPRPMHTINFTYYVSNGYLVLTPDIVYTAGYPGPSALKCVLPAIQAVVDRGIVDETAIGIQGHSWGGYQIAYMVTQTNRFRAAAAGAPVVNMIAAYDGIRWGTGLPRQFQYERTQSRIGGSIWQYPTRFIENSPIFWVDRVQTPVMILQNDADDAVPWYQGIEFFLSLRRLGKEAYLFNYNGQPHGLRNRADQKDYTIRLQQYFDHYLKGAPAPHWMEKGVPYLEREKTALSELGGQ